MTEPALSNRKNPLIITDQCPADFRKRKTRRVSLKRSFVQKKQQRTHDEQ